MKKTISMLLIAVLLLSAASLSAFAAEPGLADQVADQLHASIQRETDSPEWVTALEAAKDENTKQLFVVAGLGIDKTTASVSIRHSCALQRMPASRPPSRTPPHARSNATDSAAIRWRSSPRWPRCSACSAP